MNNRNPARPKPIHEGKIIMRPRTCAGRYEECCCHWAPPVPLLGRGYIYIPLVVSGISVVLIGLRYLFGDEPCTTGTRRTFPVQTI